MSLLILSSVATGVDEARKIATERWPSREDDTGKRVGGGRRRDGGSGLTSIFSRSLQMTLSRGVDNYLTYIAEVYGARLSHAPETLRSSETVKVEDVLKHESMDDATCVSN